MRWDSLSSPQVSQGAASLLQWPHLPGGLPGPQPLSGHHALPADAIPHSKVCKLGNKIFIIYTPIPKLNGDFETNKPTLYNRDSSPASRQWMVETESFILIRSNWQIPPESWPWQARGDGGAEIWVWTRGQSGQQVTRDKHSSKE